MTSDNKFVRSLIENAKQGNNAAIEQLFQMNLGKIYAFALRLTAKKSLAENITKDTFIEAWKKMNLVRSDASFLKWLSAITVYHTIDTLRTKKSKVKINHEELKELESKNETDKYIFELPDQERMIFVLNKIEGYTIEEISDMMGIKKDQVKVHLGIAVSKLVTSDPSLEDETVLTEKISKLIPELQPSLEVRNGIFSYIMDVKIREQKEQERIAEVLEEKERRERGEEVEEEKGVEVKEEKNKEEAIKSKRKLEFNLQVFKKIIYTILIIGVITAAYILIASDSSWEVIQLAGRPKLNDKIMSSIDSFPPESTIQTDESSSVTVTIPSIGRLLIDNSSVISRTKNNNELKLDNGQIRKFEADASEVLTVITPLAKFTELYKGSAFKLHTDENGTCKLTVESGWVIVNIKDFDSYVPKNFDCLITRGKYAIPYPANSSPDLITLLQDFSGVNDPSIGTILSNITKKESLSLWHILQLISQENRSIAFDRLNELIPAPISVTKEGILALHKSMLMKWRQEIELKMD